MRLSLILLLFLVKTSLGDVEIFKNWKSSAEKNTSLKAAIIAKNMDGKKVQMRLENKNAYWYATNKFAKEHQTYFANWIPHDEHLAVQVITSGNGKTLRITAKAGSQKMKVQCFKYHKGKVNVTKWIKPGESLTFQFKASDKYLIKAFWGKTLVDKEDWR